MHNQIQVTVSKKHPGCWRRLDGKWKMTKEFAELWWQYKHDWISRATFFRRQKELKEAYDSAF
jgi:hypothetical protein